MTAISRRSLLATGAIIAAAGAGSLVAALTRAPKRAVRAAPAPTPSPTALELTLALERERVLISSIDAAMNADSALHPILDNVRADHAAHLGALAQTLAINGVQLPATAASSVSPTPIPPSAAPGIELLRSAEQSAQLSAAHSSSVLRGAEAVLMASIAACEAGHAELLA
jgi:hypothetical protein